MSGAEHAAAVPGGDEVAGRRRPDAAGTRRRGDARRQRVVRNAVYRGMFDSGGSLLDLPAAAAAVSAGRAPLGDDAAAALRRAHQRPVDAADREQHGAARGQCRPAAARHLRSAARSSAAPRSSAATSPSRAGATWSRAAPSTSTTRRASSRSSTSRPRRACASPARPTGSSSARSAPSTASRPSSPPTRRCPRSRCWRCCSATSRPAATSSFGRYSTDITPQQQLLRERATRALTGALSSEVGRVVEQTFGVDTFQLTPSLVDPERAVVAPRSGGAADHRQAAVRPHLPDLLAQPLVLDPRPDHPARVRPDRPLLVDPVAQRRSHLRARRPRETRLLMRWSHAAFRMRKAMR